MKRMPVARPWHVVTLVVAVFALVLQLILVARGQTVLTDVGTLALAERLRRLVSYFTIQSNALVAVSMAMVVSGRADGTVFRVLRLTSLIGITVTGIVAFVALPPPPSYTTANLLCDRLLHVVVPLLTFLGWIAFGPRGQVRREDLLPSLIWPVLWLALALGLGPATNWYPYPFLNVDTIGLGRVLLNCALIAALFFGLAGATLWTDRRLGHDPRE